MGNETEGTLNNKTWARRNLLRAHVFNELHSCFG